MAVLRSSHKGPKVMIETLEEYERAKYVARVIMGPTTRKAMDTIDSLLALVREANEIDTTRYLLSDQLDGLPEWMKQEKH